MRINFSATPKYSPNYQRTLGKINFTSKEYKARALYSIDKYGSILKRHDSAKQAGREYGIDPDYIRKCVRLGMSCHGIRFVYADDIETSFFDETRGNAIDEEKLAQKIKSTPNSKPKYNHSLYLVDLKGNYKKYKDAKAICEEFDINYATLKSAQHYNSMLLGKFFVFDEVDIEKKDDDGNIYIDTKIIDDVFKKSKKVESTAVYAIDKQGHYRRYNSFNEVKDENDNIYFSDIRNSIASKSLARDHRRYILASEFESTDENGVFKTDYDKLNKTCLEIASKPHLRKVQNPIYLFNPQGSFSRFDNVKEASRACNYDVSCVYRALRDDEFHRGYKFVRGREIETKDSNGNSYIDIEKLRQVVDELNDDK